MYQRSNMPPKYNSSEEERRSLMGNRMGGGKMGNRYDENARSIMEDQNNHMVDELASKVSVLKELSINIGDHVREDNKFLSGMDRDMGSTTGALGSTINKIGVMMQSGGTNQMCWLVGFIVFVFFVLWFIVGKH